MNYPTLKELVKANPELLKDEKKRPYEVTVGGKSYFVLSNSAGNAALDVCEVRTCKPKELQAALIESICEGAKNATSPKA